jgi:hypothetical protein
LARPTITFPKCAQSTCACSPANVWSCRNGSRLLRTHAGNGTPQLHDAAAVAAVANHLVDARGAQARMLIEGLADELDVGIDDGRPQRFELLKRSLSTALRTASGWTPSSLADGANLPVFGVKVAANLRAGFRTDHEMAHLLRGMRGKGSMKRPVRPQIRQRSGKAGLCFQPGLRSRRMLLRIGRSTIE